MDKNANGRHYWYENKKINWKPSKNKKCVNTYLNCFKLIQHLKHKNIYLFAKSYIFLNFLWFSVNNSILFSGSFVSYFKFHMNFLTVKKQKSIKMTPNEKLIKIKVISNNTFYLIENLFESFHQHFCIKTQNTLQFESTPLTVIRQNKL